MKLKVDVEKLALGMYVAELDRPWLESPFLFQGFLIESEDDLERLRDVCRYVYVDDLKSRSLPEEKHLKDALPAGASGDGEESETPRPTPKRRDAAEDFRAAYAEAREVYGRSTTRMIKMLDDIRLGKSLEVEESRTIVKGLVNTISRNTNTALWLTNLQSRSQETANHCLNVAILSVAFAQYLGVPKAKLVEIGIGALLHDVGIMRLPDSITRKTGKLTQEEYQTLQTHPVSGEGVLKLTRTLPDLSLRIVRSHHERIDGTGYPDRLKGEQIPREVLLVAISDVYDAMTSDRTYTETLTPQEALTTIHRNAERDFGRELVESFIRCLGIYPIGSLVLLSNGALGLVMTSNPESRLRPVVMLVRDADGSRNTRQALLNLAGKGTGETRIERVVDPRDYGIDVAELAEQVQY